MNNRDIEYILKVCDEGNITKAADKLHISQSALSKYIAKLEEEIGIKLFTRSADGISLSEAGEIYVRYARQIQNLNREMTTEVGNLKEHKKQTRIRACMTLSTLSLSVTEICEHLHKYYPDYDFDLINCMSTNMQSMLDDHTCDLGFGPDCVDKRRFALRHLHSEYTVLAVPVCYDLEDIAEEREGLCYKWIDLNRIKDLPFIFQASSTNVYKNFSRALHDMQLEITPKAYFTNSILTILAVEKQQGCAFISESFFSYIQRPETMRLYCFGDPERYMSSMYVIHDKNRILNDAELALVEIIVKLIIKSQDEQRQFILQNRP